MLDYILTSPALSKVAKKVVIKHHTWEVSDHASVRAEFDINCAKGGKGVFRCPPNLHKNVIYQQLLRNAIRYTVLENLTQNPYRDLQLALLEIRINMEEEVKSLKDTVLAHGKQNTFTRNINCTPVIQ